MAHGIYDADGKIRCTLSPGTGFVGRYAPDGSLYVTFAPSEGFVGLSAPDGSLYVTDATGSTDLGAFAPNGSLRITTGNDLNGSLKVSGVEAVDPYEWNATSLSLPPYLSLTRAESGYYYNSSGILTLASADVPRFDYDPRPGHHTVKGLLREGARYNLIPNSSTLSNAVWGFTGSYYNGSYKSPDGNGTGYWIQSGVGSTGVGSQSVTLSSNRTSMSVYMRYGTGVTSYIGLYDETDGGYTNGELVKVTWSGGVPVLETVPAEHGTTWLEVEEVLAGSDYFYRIKIHNITTISGHTATFRIYPESTVAGECTGNGNIYWGPMVEPAPAVSSYWPTSGTPSQRPADVLSITDPNVEVINRRLYHEDQGWLPYWEQLTPMTELETKSDHWISSIVDDTRWAQSFSGWTTTFVTLGYYGSMIAPWGLSAGSFQDRNWSVNVDIDEAQLVNGGPGNCRIRWNFRKPLYQLQGYFALQYGDYFDTTQLYPITAKKIADITTLTSTHNISLTGDGDDYDVLLDFFLATTPNDGSGDSFVAEVGLFYRTPQFTIDFVQTQTFIGTTTFSGVTWNVWCEAAAAHGPYYYFLPQGYADIPSGTSDLLAALDWLVANAPGFSDQWYFQGLALGVEPMQGQGSMTVNNFLVTYA